RAARGLRALGLEPGARLALMGDACEEWPVCDLAAQAAGAITYGIYPTASPAGLQYPMRDGGATSSVAENTEDVDERPPFAGARLALMGDACEEWLVCDLAAQAAGAITYGIYPTASPAELEYQMRDGGASIFVAENQEYVDKLLPFADALPALRWIVVIDDS